MARYPFQLPYIADGFRDDCDELVHRCLQVDTLTYHAFCEIWKDMQFSCIFHGRTSGTEIAELSEEVLQIAKHYMVANTSNFEESVAGLFLVYGLLNLQPYTGFAALRVIPEDVAAIKRIELVARREQRYDVLYVLGSVLIEGPCQYHAAQRERGMESSIRKYLEGYTSDQHNILPKGVFYRQNEELDVIRELNVISRRYSEAKAAIGGSHNKDRNLSYTNDKLISELDTSLRKIISGIHDNEEMDEPASQNHYTSVQSIKSKAMRETVNQVKRFIPIDRRTTEEVTPKMTPEIMSKPGKIKSGSPTKPLTASSPKKQNSSNIKSVKSKKRKHTSQDDKCNNERVTTEVNTNAGNIDTGDNINLDEFAKSKETELPHVSSQEQALEIEIESLPVLIRSQEEGEMHVEIEVIDQYKQGNKEEAELKKKKGSTKKEINMKKKLLNSELPDLSIKKVQNSNDGECSHVASDSEMAVISKVIEKDVFKRPYEVLNANIKKPEKRDLKKTILKSKFKKMGMLPVANFKDK